LLEFLHVDSGFDAVGQAIQRLFESGLGARVTARSRLPVWKRNGVALAISERVEPRPPEKVIREQAVEIAPPDPTVRGNGTVGGFDNDSAAMRDPQPWLGTRRLPQMNLIALDGAASAPGAVAVIPHDCANLVGLLGWREDGFGRQ
jgi:hypothetical protein